MSNRIAIVTGGNRGIGLAIVRALSNSPKTTVLLTSRDISAGKAAIASLTSASSVQCHQLDTSDKRSIHKFYVKREYGKIDVLINNAGVNLDHGQKFTAENARRTLDVNYYGTLHMCQSFIPLMQDGGRVVNIASVAGHLRSIPSEDIQSRFTDSNLDVNKLDEILKGYLSDVVDGTYVQKGWPNMRSYSVSKVAVIAMTNILARENKHLYINSCCPGWVKTDMGGLVGKPTKSEDDGAKIPVRLAVGDIGGVSGEFWENPGIHDTEDGRVSKW
ncbi:hypothetical protein PROFUN_05715 [Planoprotostelium fungivorum]|uniref:Carbonyl reductase n=1 Tax=Planoprotostelium fungivorum TaxID=1890364 RepID=A0A2P6NQH0_9EUKA|nr:hypothetical protein PROFUN_05715 [Planoprotostelium fungivorum]